MSDRQDRLLLGGGIGSGKTAAAVHLGALGAHVVSSDDLARSVLEPGTRATAQVLERWPKVGTDSGVIDRALLGEIVFSDPASLADLEAITHPLVRSMIDEEVEAHPLEPIVIELPVLRDLPGRGWPWIVVDAPEELRVRRALARGVLAEEALRRIMSLQPSRGDWLVAACWVIDNSGDEQHLKEQCRSVWEEIATSD